MEDPDLPNTVVPNREPANHLAASRRRSRPGPVVGVKERVFQPAFPGKYTYSMNSASPDPPSNFSENILSSGYSLSNVRVSRPMASQFANHWIVDATTRIPGRTLESIMGGPKPPDAVLPLAASVHHSRPGPALGNGGRVSQPATTGKYTCRLEPASVDASSSFRNSFMAISSSFQFNERTAVADLPIAMERVPANTDFVSTQVRATSSNRFLSVYYQNVRGLRTKVGHLRLLLSSCEYNVLIFTETWLHADIDNAELSSEYTIFRCDRSTSTSLHSRGGGVLIAVKNDLSGDTISLPDCQQLEQVAVCIRCQHRSIYIIVIYLPPNSSPNLYSAHVNAVQLVADRLSNDDIILSIGDFNLPNLHWQLDEDTNGYIPSNASTEPEQALIESMFATGLRQVNSFVNTIGRLLDLAFVNLPEYLDLISPSTPLLPVDNHHPPFILLLDDSEESRISLDDLSDSLNFDFRAYDFSLLNEVFSNMDWASSMCNENLDGIVSTFYDMLLGALRQHVPQRKRAFNSVFNKPWWTPELKNLRNQLRKLRNRYFRTKANNVKSALRDLETLYKMLLSSTYEEYLRGIQSSVKQNPLRFWDFVRSRRSGPRIPSNVTFEGTTARSNAEAANLFATFFESVFCRASPVQRRNCFEHVPSHDIIIPVIQFSETEVQKALEDLDDKKGAGTDGIPPTLLKNCAATLACPATILFNRSLRDRIFPYAWKTASIVPIHKSGNCNCVSNYRGVSILCCLSKVFEKMIHNVLYSTVASIISDNQHGFMKHRSTTTNLMCYVTAVSREVEMRRQVDSVYIDFAKAFDSVPHNIIIDKMKHIGFPEWITEWLFSYLSGREAFVVVNSVRSSIFNISSGVPQGSVLGPLIFIIFVNDLCNLLLSPKLSFADDFKIYRIISSVVDCVALQEDINVLLIWCGDNGMRVNGKKCKIITFTRCNTFIRHQYFMGSDSLERVNSICDLGVTIDSKLKFNDHVGIITAKGFSVLGFIRRHASGFTDIYALKTLFCSLVRSILEYAAPVWSPYYLTQTIVIERVQKKFIRFALRQLPWNDPVNLPHYSERCQLIDLEILSARRVKLQRLFIFDVITGNIDCPELLAQILLNAPPRRFRNQQLLAIPFHRTNYGINNPFDACVRAFNCISNEFDFMQSKYVFSKKIRNLD